MTNEQAFLHQNQTYKPTNPIPTEFLQKWFDNNVVENRDLYDFDKFVEAANSDDYNPDENEFQLDLFLGDTTYTLAQKCRNEFEAVCHVSDIF